MEAPKYIFLQMSDDGGGEYDENESTWSDHRIYDTDMRYKRMYQTHDVEEYYKEQPAPRRGYD